MSSDAHWRGLVDAASAPYRRAGRFAWRFARGKLNGDPVFRHLLVTGLVPPRARVIDIGCGQGLLASLLLAAGASSQRGTWPAEWAAAPEDATVVGIELMPRDVERARRALDAQAGTRVEFVHGDMCTVAYPASDVVVILDVLHYVDPVAQDALLGRVRASLAGGGRLVLRIGDMASRRGFLVSQWVDRVVTWVRGHTAPPTFCRSLGEWIERLTTLGFRVTSEPMHRGTPFANILLVGVVDVPAAALSATHAAAQAENLLPSEAEPA